jgi:flagellar biosynthesis/type III secretory pathway ATPase
VLVEGDDMNEPVADAMRSILDGHLVLRRELAARNQYPALDILSSISRLMVDIVDDQQLAAAARFKDILSVFQRNEDMITIGAYQKGTSPEVDQAIAYQPKFVDFLKQPFDQPSTLEMSKEALLKVTAPLSGAAQAAPQR